MKSNGISFLLALSFLIFADAVFAQTASTGAISGTVTDPTGAVIPGADVTVASDATGQERALVTDSSGTFLASILRPGTYTVTVTMPGFSTLVINDVLVQITETTTVSARLQVGGAAEQVTVTGEPPLLQSESTTIGRVIQEQTIVDLPLVNRNYTQLLGLTRGVNTGIVDATDIGVGSQEIRANGARSADNNFQINGVPTNTGTNLTQPTSFGVGGISIPAPDTIREFKVQTSLYDAQFGRGAGANVNVETRSGTSEYHGNIYFFGRNDVLNANNFFSNATGTPRGKFLRSQPGGTLGGPIIKDRLFFFGSWQSTRDVNGASLSSSVRSLTLPPIPLDRSPESLGSVFGGQTGVFGGLAVAEDGSNINPVALRLLNFRNPDGSFLIPSPQVPGGGVNYTANQPGRFDDDQFNFNLDYTPDANNQFTGKFFRANQTTSIPFFGADVPGFVSDRLARNRNLTLSWTRTVSPTMVNEFRFGFTRIFGRSNPGSVVTTADAGINRFSDPEVGILPQIQVLGTFQLGNSPNDRGTTASNSFYWADTFSFTKGNHNMRTGVEVFRDQFNIAFTFDLGNLTVLSFPDFLLGRPAGPIESGGNGTELSNIFGSNISGGPPTIGDRQTAVHAFFQDDWKIRPNLTLNLGLRLEVNGQQTEVEGRIANFVPEFFEPPPFGGFTDIATSGFVIPESFDGPAPPDLRRGNSSLQDDPHNVHLLPRIGIAWRPFGGQKFVVRSGYGMFANRISFLNHAQQLVFIPPFASQVLLFGSANSQASLQNPFPDLPKSGTFPNFDTLFVPGPPFEGGRVPISPNLSTTNLDDPTVQHWNLDFQYQAKDYVFSVGYEGAKGSNLLVTHSISQPLLASPENPVNGQTSNSAGNAALRSPLLGIAPFNLFQDSGGNSWFHSIQAEVAKSMSHGFQFLASYTLGKSLDDAGDSLGAFGFGGFGVPTLGQNVFNNQNDRAAQKGRSDFDRRHRFVVNWIWELPDLRSSANAWVRKLTEGWSISGVATLQSGEAFSIFDSSGGSIFGSPSFFLTASPTPGKSIDDATKGGSVNSKLNEFFDPSAFARVPSVSDGDLIDGQFPVSGGGGTLFGNLGRNILSGPAQNSVDLRFAKRTFVTEEVSVLFLWEIFNAFNNPNFANPGNDIANPGSFGVISGLTVNPRIMQYGLKIEF